MSALSILTGGLVPTWAPGIIVELLSPGPVAAQPPPEFPGFGERFGEIFGGALQSAPHMPPTTSPDDGGDFVSIGIRGAPDGEYAVRVGGVAAYSGVPGMGNRILPKGPAHGNSADPWADRSIQFVMPAGLATGSHDVVIDGPDGQSWTIAGAVTVVRRPRHSRVSSLRANFPDGSYSGLRGNPGPGGGEVLDP